MTPLTAVPLPMGSYLLEISAPGRATAALPVALGRQDHAQGIPPGGTRPEPLILLPPAALGPEDRYVPTGWFLAGGMT